MLVYQYMNINTGEILTRAQMLEQWRKEYDGDDDTNIISWGEYYIKIKPIYA